MPHSEHLKGHVTYDTIFLYFVESSLITKSIWERSIYPSFSHSLYAFRCLLITWQIVYMSDLGVLLVYLWQTTG